MTLIKIGTRTSTLAMWQAEHVQRMLDSAGYTSELVGITSMGDKSLGGDLASSVGQFIHAVDAKLVTGEIDIAVHSSKDVPVSIDERISHLAYLSRGCTNDIVIFPKTASYPSLGELLSNSSETPIADALRVIPKSGTVGTVSGRRQSFLLSKRPDIIPIAVRGQVETRLMRLQQGRVDAIILAEIGLQRLNQIGALDTVINEFSAVRLSDIDWPTAPGQGAISVHCRSDEFGDLQALRQCLNSPKTESDVVQERQILTAIGGGCLYPAGIKVSDDSAIIQISPDNWRDVFCQGLEFTSQRYVGKVSDYEPVLPTQNLRPVALVSSGPKLISTLNSDRLARILQNNDISVVNKPVLELVPKPNQWPKNFLDETKSRREWPYLVLTSPFAAKCAVSVAQNNPELSRIQWLAIGEGTARACFMRGVTVSICAKARNSEELIAYIDKMISRDNPLLIPRSDVASNHLVESLTRLGFAVNSWVGYENRAKKTPMIDVEADDVLLLSSPSSARAWVENSLPIPKNILCMGKSSLEAIGSLDYFEGAQVEVLQGPTSDFVAKWWKQNRGD